MNFYLLLRNFLLSKVSFLAAPREVICRIRSRSRHKIYRYRILIFRRPVPLVRTFFVYSDLKGRAPRITVWSILSYQRLKWAYVNMTQCCGSGIFIPDLRSRIRIFSIPDPEPTIFPDPGSGPASTSKSYLKNCFWALGNMIRIPDPDLDFLPIPDPGLKNALDPGSGSATLTWRYPQYGIEGVLGLSLCSITLYWNQFRVNSADTYRSVQGTSYINCVQRCLRDRELETKEPPIFWILPVSVIRYIFQPMCPDPDS